MEQSERPEVSDASLRDRATAAEPVVSALRDGIPSAWAPAPWSVPHFAEPDGGCQCRYVLTDHLMGAVCSVHVSGAGDDWLAHGDHPRFEQACANARLIAAAPEMAQALLVSHAAMLGALSLVPPHAEAEFMNALAEIDHLLAKIGGAA